MQRTGADRFVDDFVWNLPDPMDDIRCATCQHFVQAIEFDPEWSEDVIGEHRAFVPAADPTQGATER